MLGGLRLTVRGVWIYGTGTHHRGGRLARGQHCGRRKRRKRCGAQKKRGEEAACDHHGGIEYESTRDYCCPCFDPTRPYGSPRVLYNGNRRQRPRKVV